MTDRALHAVPFATETDDSPREAPFDEHQRDPIGPEAVAEFWCATASRLMTENAELKLHVARMATALGEARAAAREAMAATGEMRLLHANVALGLLLDTKGTETAHDLIHALKLATEAKR